MVRQVTNSVLIILIFLMSSCSNLKRENNDYLTKNSTTIYNVRITLSNLDKIDLIDSTKVYIDTLFINNQKEYIYSNSYKKDSAFLYSYSTRQDSFFYFNEYCKAIDTLNLCYQKSNIEIFVSHYDEINSVDEESEIYWSKDYGLISVYNYSQGALILFENNRIDGFAKNEFLKYIVDQGKSKRIQQLS